MHVPSLASLMLKDTQDKTNLTYHKNCFMEQFIAHLLSADTKLTLYESQFERDPYT
jgi:hypothetical protein